ncbi:NADPH-dependent ferric siderophore reductase [Conyzicola lurida]|uniref:NADPH-dependent ferric siderophore reductase n=1 Tax=Conyzicola lurida TaxID=1172621 RepID=A0A841AIE2_9MICO|nr:siderophore-interacting protein [Conyzicola lurida]MBB5842118.1 NADPH-dependent ferric siderophore reductase [Conyzicola lurida]
MARIRTPDNPQLFRATVIRSGLVTPSLQRVTIGGDSLADFPWMGYDHWFRLFMRKPGQALFTLPDLTGAKWYKQWLAIPEDLRPHCANYTVADYRPADREMDIEFVVHRNAAGELEGAAAIWACSVQPGDEMAVLDQGIIYDQPDDASEVTIVADESGLPAVAGILRSLPAHAVGRVIQEVPTLGDRRTLVGPAGVTVSWIVREDTGTVAGVKALEALKAHSDVDPHGYGFVIGESKLATEGRRHLHRLGLPKSRITFSGFWKH